MPAIENQDGEVLHEVAGDSLANAFLANKYLRGAQLSGMDLSGADLRDAKLIEADLSHANLIGCKLDNADLPNANLTGAKFDSSALNNTALNGCQLTKASFVGCELTSCQLESATAENAVFDKAKIHDCSLVRLQADNASFQAVEIKDTTARGASLKNVDFSSSYLFSLSVEYADLTESVVTDSTIHLMCVSAAKLNGIDFTKAKSVRDFFLSKPREQGSFVPWPHKRFGSNVGMAPFFDDRTFWPESVRFPKRWFNWRFPVFLGALPSWIILDLGRWLLPETLGKYVTAYCWELLLAGIGLSVVLHVIQIMLTNQMIRVRPDKYFSCDASMWNYVFVGAFFDGDNE